jgi:hypothetical protein
MNWNKVLSITVIILLIFASACDLPAGLGGNGGTTQATTVPLDTLVAQMVAGTEAAQTVIANLAVVSTPQATFTPSLTPTLKFTSTPKVPMVSVSVTTNCRSGPGVPYAILGVLSVGQTAQVVGQNPLNGFWIIDLAPQHVTCWLWNQYATVTGSTAGLPVITPPVSPTPVGSFTVAYSSTQTCSGGEYGLKFQVNNEGNLAWESNQVTATDITAGVTGTVAYDIFPNYKSSDCSLINSTPSLAPGKGGTTSVFGFPVNPAGHNFKVTIKLCSQNALAGACLEKTLNFKL